jgi:CubicO group peptidase (beta-lactamase class C family)
VTNRDFEHRIDSLFAAWDKPDSPGAAVLVMKDGETIFKKGYGFANLEHNVPIEPTTVFHVASVSKQFTAMAIAILAHEGKLSLDDRVQKHVPELPEFEHPITVRHLVHHVSGLRDQWELLTLAGWRMDDVITTEHLIKIITHQKNLNFEPGSKYLYSNSGYTLMALIVERVSGKPFPEYLREAILEPLAMRNSHVHDDHQLIVKNRAYSYSPKERGGFKKSILSYANFGATSLFTTVEDLAKWMMNYTTAKVGGPEVISQMHERYTLTNGKTIDYAFGLMYKEYKGLQLIYHTGSDAGFRAYFGRFPEQGLGIIILSNVSSFPREPMAMKIADIFLEDENTKQEGAKPAEFTRIAYTACPGTYLVKSLGKLLEVHFADGRLSIQLEGWPEPLELVKTDATETRKCLEEDEFFESDSFTTKHKEAQVTFISEEGKVNQLMPSPYQLMLNTYGEDMGAEKIEVKSLLEQELTEYVGAYYSHELGTTYYLNIIDGQLVAQHRRHNDIVLIATGKDRFLAKTGPLSRLDFVRNEQNAISGLNNTGSRGFNLKFEKQASLLFA